VDTRGGMSSCLLTSTYGVTWSTSGVTWWTSGVARATCGLSNEQTHQNSISSTIERDISEGGGMKWRDTINIWESDTHDITPSSHDIPPAFSTTGCPQMGKPHQPIETWNWKTVSYHWTNTNITNYWRINTYNQILVEKVEEPKPTHRYISTCSIISCHCCRHVII
jgi:hypothetical protein